MIDGQHSKLLRRLNLFALNGEAGKKQLLLLEREMERELELELYLEQEREQDLEL